MTNPYWSRRQSSAKRIVKPSDYSSLLGANLVALWHQAQGVAKSGSNVTAWTDVVSGKSLSVAGGGASPQYASDVTNFKSKPVVQFAANAKYLATATSTLISAGARPYVFCVSRWRDGVGDYPYVWQLNATQDMVHFTSGTAGHQLIQFRQPGILYADGGVHNTSQHFDEAWLDGTLGHMTRDGTDHTVAATGAIVPAIDQITLGGTNNFGNLSIFLWGVCTAAPSAAQMNALRALVNRDAGS